MQIGLKDILPDVNFENGYVGKRILDAGDA